MTLAANFSFRSAHREDAKTVFHITKASIGGLARTSYSPDQIENWMGERTPAFYEELIAKGRMTVYLRGGVVVGFVDAEPGEVTRLFILPEAGRPRTRPAAARDRVWSPSTRTSSSGFKFRKSSAPLMFLKVSTVSGFGCSPEWPVTLPARMTKYRATLPSRRI
jgi:hypothetical protein